MISRQWHGWTTPEKADAYERLLKEEVLVGIGKRGIPGYRGAHLWRRSAGDVIEFVTVLWFDSLEDVRLFAGEPCETAVVPTEARALLSRFDATSAHYEVLASPTGKV